MPVSHDSLFLYRFDTPKDRVYGPRTLEWIGEVYGSRPECECAPAAESGTDASGPWRPVQEWLGDMIPAPATSRQITRLKNLEVEHDEGLTRDAARELIRDTEADLPPTKPRLREAEELGVAVPEGVTRGELAALVDQARLKTAARALRRKGIALPENASWEDVDRGREKVEEEQERKKLRAKLQKKGVPVTDDMTLSDLEELDFARDDFDDAVREARRFGLEFSPPAKMSIREMEQFTTALYELEENVGMIEASVDHLVENGWVSRKPRKAEIKQALPELFGRLLSGEWKGDHDDEVWFVRRAVGQAGPVPSRGEPSGCMTLLMPMLWRGFGGQW